MGRRDETPAFEWFPRGTPAGGGTPPPGRAPAERAPPERAPPERAPGERAPAERAPGPRAARGRDEGPAEETLTVPQVALRVKSMLASAFPEPFWLVGEASGLTRGRQGASGHWFFNLVDDQSADSRARACLSVTLWRTSVTRLFGPRGRLRALVPEDGVVLRVKVRPDFYAPRGSLNFIIEDIDPEFTLGNLDRQRRELLARLEAEGALAWNRAVFLADVPLRIGLITSVESAAYNDVLQTLAESRLGLTVLVCDARMQGEDTGRSVRAALAALLACRPDVILLCRGGGSRLDLSWFDREDIARAIATCPVPVLTGIGHEIDSSVADAVAHGSFKTPTAAAQFLVERARDGLREVNAAFAELLRLAQDAVSDGQALAAEVGGRLRRAALGRVQREAGELALDRQALASAAERSLASARHELLQVRERLGRGRHMERLAALDAQLAAQRERLAGAACALLDRQAGLLSAAGDTLRLLDPRHVLARGFAWLRRPDGSVLKDAAAARAGEILTAVLRDGDLPLSVRGPAVPGAEPRPVD
ncbi:MAG TPA: exodeoxyribonuclease VII large subunit [Planctomycetota bacterium]|nr:exodeoxyribonuclease VII large subunit [Planctomycetota bacterium]